MNQTVEYFMPLLALCLFLRAAGEVSSDQLFDNSSHLMDHETYREAIERLTAFKRVRHDGGNLVWTGPNLTF